MADYYKMMQQFQDEIDQTNRAERARLLASGQIVSGSDPEGGSSGIGYWNQGGEGGGPAWAGPGADLAAKYGWTGYVPFVTSDPEGSGSPMVTDPVSGASWAATDQNGPLIAMMMRYIQENPNDPAAQAMQADLTRMQADAHKGDFGSFLHGLAVSAAAGGAASGAFGGGSIFGGLPPAGGEMLGEGVFGPPAPGGSFFVGPPSPGFQGFVPGPAVPTPILGEGLMGPPAPGGDFFTGPPTPAGTPAATPAAPAAAPAGMPPVQNIPGQGSPLMPTTPGTTNTIIPGDGTAAATAATGSTGNALGNWLRSNGVNVSDDALSVLGRGAGLLTGLLGSNAQQNALQGVLDRQTAERKPALDAFYGALSNPGSWYQSAPAMGAAEGILRKLSVNGNPAGNPADLAKAAAYNLGGYNDYLGKMGSLGLSGQATTAQLGSQLAGAQGNTYNLLGAGINELTQPKSDPIADLQRLLRGGSFSLN